MNGYALVIVDVVDGEKSEVFFRFISMEKFEFIKCVSKNK